jgi:hypothetical protein
MTTVTTERRAMSLLVQVGAAATSEAALTAFQQQSELWVDKYAPRKFTDLLSSETINRNVSLHSPR